MIKGINGVPYIDMEPHLDMATLAKLEPEIMRGFAEAREYAKEGTWMRPGFEFDAMSYKHNWKPVYQAIEEFLALPDDDPIKMGGIDLYRDFDNYKVRNKFTRYLKMAMGAYDPYIYYFLWAEGSWDDRAGKRQLTEEAHYFPNVVKWVENLITTNVFESIGRVIFFNLEGNGLAFEHRDLGEEIHGILKDGEYAPHLSHFLHIRPNTKKAFYIWDPATKNKVYLNTRAAWFNDQDWHGGERVIEPSWSLRIDGTFSKEMLEKLGVNPQMD